MVSKKSVGTSLPKVEAVQNMPGAQGMLPATRAIVERIGKLKPGQKVLFTFASSSEAESRQGSLRKLRRKKKLDYKLATRQGSKIWVER